MRIKKLVRKLERKRNKKLEKKLEKEFQGFDYRHELWLASLTPDQRLLHSLCKHGNKRPDCEICAELNAERKK